jgi:hypothetical protein
MKTSTRNVGAIIYTLLTLFIFNNATIYNKALSTTAGGTATATSSIPYASGYEPKWAIDGVLTFCNSVLCPGPYLN